MHFFILSADRRPIWLCSTKESPNWIHVLSVLRHSLNMSIPTFLRPRMPLKQKAPAFMMHSEDTSVFVCAACLFVRFFTSLLMSAQINMAIQKEGREAQSAPTYSVSWEKKMQCEQKLCAYGYLSVVCVRAHTCMHFYVQWIWSGFWNQPWGLIFHTASDWLSKHAFPLS